MGLWKGRESHSNLQHEITAHMGHLLHFQSHLLHSQLQRDGTDPWEQPSTRIKTNFVILQSQFHTPKSCNSSEALSLLIQRQKNCQPKPTSAKSRIFLTLISALSRSIWWWGGERLFAGQDLLVAFSDAPTLWRGMTFYAYAQEQLSWGGDS